MAEDMILVLVVVASLYALVSAIVAFALWGVYADERDDQDSSPEQVTGAARRVLLAPLWPLLAILYLTAPLIDFWHDLRGRRG